MKMTLTALVLLAGALAPAAARAETVKTCTGFITALPTVISTQGTWCMDKDLATAMETGNAVTIGTNNVTIDCNGFKLGNLAAGADTGTYGIYAQDRLNVTVRNCNVRGFFVGILIFGNGGGHLVEDNRLDASRWMAIRTEGDGTQVRGNSLFDTGGATYQSHTYAIASDGLAHVMDNLVSGVEPGDLDTNAEGTGIAGSFGDGSRISGNRIAAVTARGPSGVGRGIRLLLDSRVLVDDNVVAMPPAESGGSIGIQCFAELARARDNFLAGPVTPLANCTDDGNLSN